MKILTQVFVSIKKINICKYKREIYSKLLINNTIVQTTVHNTIVGIVHTNVSQFLGVSPKLNTFLMTENGVTVQI